MTTDLNASRSDEAFTAAGTVSKTSSFTYDQDSGLLTKAVLDDGQTTHLCYYPVKASADKADRSDQVPALASLLKGFKLEKDESALSTVALGCPEIPDVSNPPLLAQCSYLTFPDGSCSEMNISLYSYASVHKSSSGVLMPDTTLSLEGVEVDTSTTPWTLAKAPGRQGLVVTLQQVSSTPSDTDVKTETTSTRWFKDNRARQTQKLTETTTIDTSAGTLQVKSQSPLALGALNLTATLAQHIRSARSGRVLVDTEQDELGRPASMAYYTYDARDRFLTSTTYAWNAEKFSSEPKELEALSVTTQQWIETGNGTWIVTVGPDGRKGRTLLDGLQRPVRRELQRTAGSDDSAQNYVCLEEVLYGADGEPQQQCIYDYHPGGGCVRNDGASLPASLRDWFWQAEACDDQTKPDGTQIQRIETLTGTMLRGPLHSVENTQTNQADGSVTLAVNHKRWDAASQKMEATGLSREQRINNRGLCDQVIEKIGNVSRKWTLAYDELGRRTQTTAPDGTVVTWAFEGLSTVPTKVSIQAKSGAVRELGRQSLGGEGNHGSDIESRVVGAEGSTQKITFLNDGYQRPDGTKVWNESSTDGSSVSWYIKGNQASAVKAKIATFTYNEITQAIKVERLEASVNLQSKISTESLSPRLLGQTLTTRTLRGMHQREHVQQSLRGDISQASFNNGIATRVWHDGQNRRTRVRRMGLDYRYRYAGQGELDRLFVSDRANGRTLLVSFDYDTLGRETQRTYHLNGEIKSRYEQTWSVSGQLLSKSWFRNGESEATRSETFAYETHRNELKQWSVRASKGFEIQDKNQKGIQDQAYTYDALGNLLTCVTTFLDGASETREFVYGNALQPTQRTGITVTHTPNGGKAGKPTTHTLVSDKNGSLTTDDSDHQFVYTPVGQLQSVTSVKDRTLLASYEYDHIGRLASQWDESKQQRRVMQYKGDQLCGVVWLDAKDTPVRGTVLDEEAGLVVQCQEMSEAAPAARYCFRLPDPQNGGAEEYSMDAHGDWVSQSIGLTPWGEASLDSLNALNSGLGYNGQCVDPVTGAYHLGNGYRVYDPRFQAFFQGDSLSPFGEGGLNDRAYCAGRDPVNWHDPSGHIMISRREEASTLASLDEMIHETVPPHHEPAAWWEWLILAGVLVLGIIGAILTGGLLGVLLLAVAGLAFGLGAAELSLRQSNPALSSKLGWASLAVGLFDASGKGLAKLGSVLLRGASKGVRALTTLRSSMLRRVEGLYSSLSRGARRGLGNIKERLLYRVETVSKAPVKTIPGRVSKQQRDALNASRPATPPSNVSPPRMLHVPHVVAVDDLGDYQLYRRAYHPSDRVVMSFHGMNSVRGGKVEIPAHAQLNHYAPATGTANTDIAYIRRTNTVARDLGLERVAAGTGNVTKVVPGSHFTSNYVIEHFEKFSDLHLRQLVEKYNVDILVLKPKSGPRPLANAFNTLDSAGHSYKVYDFVACRASELKMNIPFMKLPSSKI